MLRPHNEKPLTPPDSAQKPVLPTPCRQFATSRIFYVLNEATIFDFQDKNGQYFILHRAIMADAIQNPFMTRPSAG